jgi:thioredoxin-like negative regulator of GroEL
MIVCSAKLHGHAPHVEAVIEWFDVVTSEWRPICRDCERLTRALAEQAAEMTGHNTAAAVARAVAARFRPLE